MGSLLISFCMVAPKDSNTLNFASYSFNKFDSLSFSDVRLSHLLARDSFSFLKLSFVSIKSLIWTSCITICCFCLSRALWAEILFIIFLCCAFSSALRWSNLALFLGRTPAEESEVSALEDEDEQELLELELEDVMTSTKCSGSIVITLVMSPTTLRTSIISSVAFGTKVSFRCLVGWGWGWTQIIVNQSVQY